MRKSVILSFVFWFYANQPAIIAAMALIIGAMYSMVIVIKKGGLLLCVQLSFTSNCL